MAITRGDVEHVAYLARLGLSGQELDRLAEQLSHILETMRTIDRLDTSAIPPTASVLPLRDVMRDDEAGPSCPPAEILANAPRREDDAFLVPPVLE
jgi:aspartyl-tRNA(Asn)/glutamyl-tRNA(Gln) amidotransferase subunit C